MSHRSRPRRRPTRPTRLAGLVVLGLASAAFADATQRPKLDPDFPVRFEDAYPVGFNDAYLKFVSRYVEETDGTSITQLTPELAWGFAPHLDVHINETYDIGDGPRTGSGDTNLNVQYLFNEEKEGEWLPAVAVEADVLFPTGVGSEGFDTILQVITTKTITYAPTWDELHLNLTWTHNFLPNETQRDDAYNVIVGYSRRITDSTTFLADVVWERLLTDHGAGQEGEVGLIQELGEHLKIAGGVGFSLGDDEPDYTATLAFIISR